MRFEFLKEHRGEIGPIKKACGLMKVSKSGFYEYLGRKKSDAQIEREAIEGFVVEAFERHKGRYGYRRINRELRKSGIVVSEKRVLRIMQKLGLAGKGATRKHRIQKKVEPGDPRLNLVERAFTVGERNRLWVGDITYIPTGEGWLYLAIVKDLCTRKIVGYAFSQRIDTQLTLDALNMAVRRERPAPGLIFHSDRGVQYAAAAFRKRLAALGIRQSMSRKGDPYDNAVAENFFSCLKCELVHLRRFDSRRAAQADLFTYIEAFYNTIRPHSSLGWLPPRDFEKRLLDWEAA